MEEARNSEPFEVTRLFFFASLIAAFLTGHILSSRCKIPKHMSSEGRNSCRDPVLKDPMFLQSQVDSDNLKVASLASKEFSCNSQFAFEELTRLHKRHQQLEAHLKKGEANRDRSAVILRKTGQARAAENAFRECMNSMMPELLSEWDALLESNKINFYAWDDKNEAEHNGITLEVLNEVADTFE